MSEGILEGIIKRFENDVKSSKGIVKLEYITTFVKSLQQHQYDAHVVIMGNNGQGKSLTMLALMKMLDSESLLKDNIVYAHHKTSHLIKMLTDLHDSVIGIDEAKRFFHYKLSMTTEQIVLTNMIEYARENRNAFIVCTNDVRRLNNNYRNAKVQMVIWILDRFENGKYKSYGLIFIGNPAVEEDDKFMMNNFVNLFSFESIRIIAEALPTFYGYLLIDDVFNYITKEEYELYKQNKKRGIEQSAREYIERLREKENPMPKPAKKRIFEGFEEQFYNI